ncbi:MAG: 4-hydroxy-3-methylbut-2-enyl diphosphate reductase [Deltaproteobacteria bacterium]|nr:4-hydroxy-3-methylbut-2-enyl diphosphate reductase [Deltaproteobacteria bacterium]
MNRSFDILLASPRGFCAGVERAIETVKLCLEKHDRPVYVLHEIVHNMHVIKELADSGAIFVEHLNDIKKGEVCIFSAHGVSTAVEKYASDLGLRTVDATCPLVGSVHRMVEKYYSLGYDVIIIGHHNHPEVEGTAGRVEGTVHIVADETEAEKFEVSDPARVAYVTQTTLCKNDVQGILSVLKTRFPAILGPRSNICFATQNRQNAVKKLAESSDILLVVGSKNSSNSNRLKEVGRKYGVKTYLIDDKNDIQAEWIKDVKKVGITAGASAPERLVDGVIDWMLQHGGKKVIEMDGIEERIHFKPAVLS